MSLIADILLIAGALGAAFYCMVLSRRLSRFTDLEKGVGGAVAVLSMQVDDLKATLERARESAGQSSHRLEALTGRGEGVAGRLELMLAALNDLPEAAPREPVARAEPVAKGEPAPLKAQAEAAPVMFSSSQAKPQDGPQEEPQAEPQEASQEERTIFSSKRLSLTEDAA